MAKQVQIPLDNAVENFFIDRISSA